MADDSLFRAKAPRIVEMLMADFGLSVDQAAAIVGNLGHESGGFKFLQEIKPLVPGARGGFGWAQWTGSRRKQFEKWVEEQGLDAHSDEANYGFLKEELENTETAAIPAVKAAVNLEDAVRRFEQTFERAHPKYKHYPSRVRYAQIARAEFLKREGGVPEAISGTEESVLSFGMRGPQVTAIQNALFDIDYAVGKRDGIFGGLTRAAVLAFQADNDLMTTGMVDKATWDKLASAPPRPLSRERTTKTATELAAEGSNTVIQGKRATVLGWVTGIVGALGIGNGVLQAGACGGSTCDATVSPQAADTTVRQTLDALTQMLGAMGDQANVAQAKQMVTQLQQALSTGTASGLPVDLNALTSLLGGLLPGVPSSVLAIALGVAARYIGNQVIESRMQDHRDASNIGR